MADSKKKIIKQREKPKGKQIHQAGDPESFYRNHPAWCFNNADKEMWPFDEEYASDYFWGEILPKLQGLETQTWQDILVGSKKQNHSIEVNELNKIAQDRLAARFIEAESLISLRLNGTHRLYGYMVGSIYNILWFDTNHGENSKCVCRSKKKHT